MSKKISSLDDLEPNPTNHNQHTPRGMSLMESSLRSCGYGDSMTVDKNGVVISGDGRLETLQDIGMVNPIVVQSDGTRPIIHQRTDLEAGDEKARRLAYFQNWVGHENFDLDVAVLTEDLGTYDLTDIFSQQDIDTFLHQVSEPAAAGESDKSAGESREPKSVQCPECGHTFSLSSKEQAS